MNIKALRAFRAALSGGSLAAAAEKLHLSQPATSRLISALEGELKLKLFDRSNRNLRPTREGLAFYSEAGRILDNLDEIPRIAADIRAGRNRRLRIIAMPRVAHLFAAPAVADFLHQQPDINVNFDVRARRESNEWLVGREYDIGIGALPIDHPQIETRVLLRARAVAVVPRNHPLAERDDVDAEALADFPVIRLMRGLLLRDQLDDVFSSAGITARQVCDVSSSQLACQLVAEGAGITLADEIACAAIPGDELRTLPLVPPRWMSFGLLYPKGSEDTPERAAFIAALTAQAQHLAKRFKGVEIVSAI
ncbi:MAG: LysR family transcriptional regulator [Pseudomonadales bacterium]